MQIDHIEEIIRGKERHEFQDYCERFLRINYGNDFRRIIPNGRDGDGGKDGYCYGTKEYFAISSRKDTNKKIKDDFENCIKNNSDIKKITFITNRVLTSKDWEVVDNFKTENPKIEFGVLTYKDLASDIARMSLTDIEIILNRKITFPDQKTSFFEEDVSKRESFTLMQSLSDSLFYYIFVLSSLILLMVIFFVFSKNEILRATMIVITPFLIYIGMVKYKKRISKTKFPLRIISLILSGELRVGQEVLFVNKIHFSIYRDSLWGFSFRKRSTNCIKTGCCGKVYLHLDKSHNIIGKCEKDRINHTYKVDNNFYGELL